ncbi:ComEC family competence protein [Candidatus Parcubacteria bacterium]|nr:ComEC family competence protein [Candidatus Parcubacteria bacterium]
MNRLLLVSVIGFALGVLAFSLFEFGWSVVVFIFLLGIVFLFFRVRKKSAVFTAASIFMLAAVLGGVRVLLQPSALQDTFVPLIETRTTLEGVIVADPDLREEHQRLTVKVEKEGAHTNILVVTQLFPHVSYGERIRFSGTLQVPEPFDTDNGRTFRYDTFLAKDGIFSVMQNATIEVIARREGILTHIRGALSDFKFTGIDALGVALPEPQASLAAGLILGGKQGLGEELLADFIRSGLIHVVVLSGYNVMIVADFVLRLFGFLSKRFAASAAALTIGAFVLAAGAGPASIRAGLMAGFALYGRATGKTYEAFRALVIAGLLMVVWSPLTLAYDPGFQLSFVATLGLIFGTPIVERWFAFVKNSFLREIASATVAAQTAVLPLLLYQNGLFSLVALPANFMVLPIIPLAMLLSALAGLAGLLVPFAAPVLALPAYGVLSFITLVVETASRVPFSALSLPAFPFVFVLIAYVLVGWFVRRAMVRTLKPVSQQHPS